MNIKKFFTEDQKKQILDAIGRAEQQTSGEIRLHLEKKCADPPLERAAKLFQKLQMHKTRQRNGVLIYLAVSDKKLAVFGDEGINQAVPDNFWADVKDELQGYLGKGNYSEGVIAAINRIGEKLKEFFPYQDNDVNELPDEISTGT